ncbi:MBL fold metallo-hydrolase [Halosegnis rubeus]|jgi:phosphoribosyl 1,2-cyclic phosphate phosphodiesterase|uniref:MBL fold metallo-hydrolase n=1 Tax=Halosegnis rubeus TaxID=2212850 RepID=A0A5N5UL46_9EURY|nr:MBL fold metallo-hydrolase [Halosegnis rubeus]KAB7514535.1 MBL fold metallo-hydrolase [Halosegnis rubeus]KAB7517868.1 MBL fold metallo-hydrolase [Halosegnis rubeus]KAB7519552.1 MBL fold metallo-hydrolase [Halosegnis rubeus]
MQVTLLGTGDTTGTPTPGCDCDTCERARELGVERTRFSVHIHNEVTDESLLVDISPDFRHQMLDHEVSLPDAALVTHIHFDHLHGMGNAYRLLSSLPVHAADETDPETGKSVAETVAGDYDYLDAVTVTGHDAHESFEVCGFEVTFVPVVHPPLVCYGVRIDHGDASLAITGDTNFGIADASREALSGADLLLADGITPASRCQYHPLGGDHHDDDGVPRTFGTKHMTIEGARDLAAELDADRYRVLHVSHFTPADRAFEDPLAVDGEQYQL